MYFAPAGLVQVNVPLLVGEPKVWTSTPPEPPPPPVATAHAAFLRTYSLPSDGASLTVASVPRPLMSVFVSVTAPVLPATEVTGAVVR